MRRFESGPSRSAGRRHAGHGGLLDQTVRPVHADAMAGREEFLVWVTTTLYDAELALHNGDAGPRRAIWSRTEPVSVLGAWRNAYGQREVAELFTALERTFSDCTSYTFDLQAYDVVADMAFTVGLEHTSTSVDGDPRSYTLRATQVYRRESGQWKVAHRHADTDAAAG
jgi:ketosteroid isomerase-like protein